MLVMLVVLVMSVMSVMLVMLMALVCRNIECHSLEHQEIFTANTFNFVHFASCLTFSKLNKVHCATTKQRIKITLGKTRLSCFLKWYPQFVN